MQNEIVSLVKKEFRLEMRRKASLSGIFLYLLSATFVAYLAFGSIVEVSVWVALFWVITMFSVINAAAKSFNSESGNRSLYYYSITGARSFILSKLVYNFGMACLTSALGLMMFLLFFPLGDTPFLLLLVSVVAGSLSFSAIVTMMSSLSVPSGGSSTLVSVLSFPLMLPVLIASIKATVLSLTVGFGLNLMLYWFVLILMAVIVWVLALVLFPYIWKE